MFSKKATKIDKIFTVDLTVTTYCQIDGEDFVNFCGLLRKRELYLLCLFMDENTSHNKAYTFLPAGLVVVVAAVVLFVLAVVVGFTVGLVFLSAICPVVGN